MKKLSRISLHNLSQSELVKREENLLKGGNVCPCICVCPCAYAGDKYNENDSLYGGSSTLANDDANTENNWASNKS